MTLKTVFAYPFRVFFLSVAAWAILAVALWVGLLNGADFNQPAWPLLVWHRHEMLFGFLSPAIAGFLLTAVCVWTNTERLHGLRLGLLWALWLGGRIIAGWGGSELAIAATVINVAFLPAVALDAGWRIVKSGQSRHLPILLVLLLMATTQAGMLLTGLPRYTDCALLLVAALMLLIGGRITPAFSANWLRAQGRDPAAVRTPATLDYLLAAAMAILLASVFLALPLSASAALLTAALALARLYLWRGWLTVSEPLLWVLHLSLLWIPLALVLLAGHLWWQWPVAAWHHAMGIGAMGSLVLGVMARVSLGHTGRPLTLPPALCSAFVLLQLAVILRIATAFELLPWRWGTMASALAWCIPFVIFLWRYSAILSQPREDGKEG